MILVLESLLYTFKKLLTVCLILFLKLFKSKVLHALRPQGLLLVRLVLLGLCSKSLIYQAFLYTYIFISRGFSSVSIIAVCHLNSSVSDRLLSIKLYSLVTKPIQAKGRRCCMVLFDNSKLRRKEEIYSI